MTPSLYVIAREAAKTVPPCGHNRDDVADAVTLALIEEFKKYRPQHDEDCQSHRCFVCQTPRHSNLRIETHDHMGGTNKLHAWQYQECSCGLSALLGVPRAGQHEKSPDQQFRDEYGFTDHTRSDQSGASIADPRDDQGDNPPQCAVDIAMQMSTCSPCQSKRGAVIFALHGGLHHILGRGYNHKAKFECDSSDTCKVTCRRDAIHAEQMALINAAKTGFIVGMEALHVKTVNGALVASGGPSCVECSKLLRASGVVAVWLYHAEGWQRYEIDDFHALSIPDALPPAPESSKGTMAEIGISHDGAPLSTRLRDLADYAANGPESPMVSDMVTLMRAAAEHLEERSRAAFGQRFRHLRDGVTLPCTLDELLADTDRFAIQSDTASWYVGALAEAISILTQVGSAPPAAPAPYRSVIQCCHVGCIAEATREFCYAGEPWIPYCADHQPQYATAGERPLESVGSAPPAAQEQQVAPLHIDTNALRAALRWFDEHAAVGSTSIEGTLHNERQCAIHRITLVQTINLIDLYQRDQGEPVSDSAPPEKIEEKELMRAATTRESSASLPHAAITEPRRNIADDICEQLRPLRNRCDELSATATKDHSGSGGWWELSGYGEILDDAMKRVRSHRARVEYVDRQIARMAK